MMADLPQDLYFSYDHNCTRALIGHHPRTSPSCTDRVFLVRCPRHVQSVFNLIVDILMAILVMIN